ncbi:MAG: DUF177 domain-containing protein [Gemmatimonadaceae bacterium]
MAMLCFNIRSLEARAESVDDVLDPTDPVWQAGDTYPLADGVHVHGRLAGAGQGRFYFSGTLSGQAIGECRRCLSDVTLEVAEEVQVLFAEAGLDEADEDDVVPIPSGARELDLRPAIREEWLLAVPAFALCREACLGICPTCGADRNAGACGCAPAADPRWDDLRTSRTSDT